MCSCPWKCQNGPDQEQSRPPDKRHLTRRSTDRCLTPSGRGRLGPVCGPACGSKGSEPTPTGPPTTSNCSHMNCSHRCTMLRCSPRGSLPLSTLHSPHFPDANEEKSLPQGTPVGKDPRWFSAGENLARSCPWFSAGENLKARFCPRLARYRARPDITKRQIAHCSTSRCWWRGSVCASPPERTHKGKHNVKFTVLVMFFLVMFFGDKCDAR